MAGADDDGICGFLWLICSQLVSCAPPNNVCYQPGHVCVRHPRCFSHPVCYPLSMAGQICPPTSSKSYLSRSNTNGRKWSHFFLFRHMSNNVLRVGDGPSKRCWVDLFRVLSGRSVGYRKMFRWAQRAIQQKPC
jgi:hypothetical protein